MAGARVGTMSPFNNNARSRIRRMVARAFAVAALGFSFEIREAACMPASIQDMMPAPCRDRESACATV